MQFKLLLSRGQASAFSSLKSFQLLHLVTNSTHQAV